MKKRIPFEKRPTCSCGVKMKLEKYKGYYDSFLFWDCDNCSLGDDLDKFSPDREWEGAFA